MSQLNNEFTIAEDGKYPDFTLYGFHTGAKYEFKYLGETYQGIYEGWGLFSSKQLITRGGAVPVESYRLIQEPDS